MVEWAGMGLAGANRTSTFQAVSSAANGLDLKVAHWSSTPMENTDVLPGDV